jgi:hypothetical protein
MGWRYLMFTLGGITGFIFFLRFVVFRFQESPKFLVSKGKDEAAVRVLENVSKTNGRTCGVTLEKFALLSRADDAGSGDDNSGTPILELPGGVKMDKTTVWEKVKFEVVRLKILFSTPTLIRITLLVWVIYAFDYWGFSIAGSFLPTILRAKNSEIQVSVSETYRDYVIIFLPGIVGVGLGAFMVRSFFSLHSLYDPVRFKSDNARRSTSRA